MLDRATLTLGDTTVVNFSQSIIVMTSNLGAKDMSRLMLGHGLGYHAGTVAPVDKTKITDIAKNAAVKHFTPRLEQD